MINTQVQLKREQFGIQIRKQAREEIFSRKRLTVLNANLDGNLKCSPDEMILQIYNSYMLKDYKSLYEMLIRYNELLLIIMQRNQEADEMFMNQYVNHFSVNQETIQLFIQILRMSDVSQESSLDEIRMLNMNNVLQILINITYQTAPQIITNLLNHDISDILLNDILGRMNTKQKLRKNFDIWQSTIDSLCQLFINLLLDLVDQRGVLLKIEIMKSPFFKIWQYIYQEYPPLQLWASMMFLQQLLFINPEIKEIEIVSSNMKKILKQCCYVIEKFSAQDQLYELALLLINYCIKYQLQSTIILTKHKWMKILDINKFPSLMYCLFINFTSENYNQDSEYSDLNTEKHLIDIGLLKNMQKWLSNSTDEYLIIQIFKCLNNILTFQYFYLADQVISCFLPIISLYIEGSKTNCKVEFVNEYLLLLKNLFKFQKLIETNFNQIFEKQNVMKQIREILQQSCFSSCKILELFDVFDGLSINFKYILLKKIQEYQIIDILNSEQTKHLMTYDYIDTLLEQIAKWQSETIELNYS